MGSRGNAMPIRPSQRTALSVLILLILLAGSVYAAESFSPARVVVYFSPNGGATDAVVRELNAAKTQVLMQAYSFTSAPIAKALVEAHTRGVKILAVLDKSNQTEKYSAATFLNNADMQPLIDDQHAIAHSKVIVIDSATIRPTVSPLLTPVSSRNALLLQSLPTNTPFRQVNSRRRKDDTRVGTAARGIVERLSRLPRRLP
jgi:phosphatidylserine/phosphatidylglycerophosphate/cardiolipin synthase-like enzyme